MLAVALARAVRTSGITSTRAASSCSRSASLFHALRPPTRQHVRQVPSASDQAGRLPFLLLPLPPLALPFLALLARS